MKRLMIALALALAPATALAQAPADDAVLAAAPSNISLTFEHAVILTQVQVHGPGQADGDTSMRCR